MTPALWTSTPTAARPSRDPIGDPAAGLARVLPDDGLRTGNVADEIVPESAADQIRALFGERKFPGDAADAVSSE